MGEQTNLAASPSPAPAVEAPGRLDRFGGFALVCLQLALVLVAVYQYEIAARNHFFLVLCIAVGGFVVRVCLPPRFRAAFFALLSLGAVFLVLGWPEGGFLIGIGSVLIAICYLPVPFAARVALIVVAAAVLTVLRLDFLDYAFWPVLGSMFMFRLIGFLIDLRRAPGRPPLALALAFFFPLQNLSFLFFPILDFKTFRETYRADAGWREAQAGIGWIALGLLHLLAYRVVKYYVLPAPHELGDLPRVALFLAAGYALYLHISGYFHIITGVFHLFGFGLPRTHHNYFLASSFTDVWRRINIYWKDFMAKVFFFPAFFALRGAGTRVAIAAAALWVFLMTWLLHAYQVFWITGELPLNVSDAGLWLAAGVLVAANLQYDLTRARRPAVERPAASPVLGAVGWSARVVGMFALVSLFWAYWNTPEFLGFVRAQATSPRGLPGGWQLAAAITAVVVILTAARLAHDRLVRVGALPLRWTPVRSAVALTVLLGLAALVSVPRVGDELGERAARTIATLRHESATPMEAARAVQGYYEKIADTPVRAGGWLTDLEGRPRDQRQTHYTDMTRPTDDLLEQELIPNWSGELRGSRLTVNRHGMRDRPDRTVEKSPGTLRVAAVGSSNVMGYGVGDAETFPYLLEDRLNARRRPDTPHYEVLNFGTGKSFAIHRRVLLDRKVFAFSPDVVLYFAHQDELQGTTQHLAMLIERRNRLRYPCLEDVVRKAGITPDTPPGVALARLQPLGLEVVGGMYREFASACRARGVRPVWVYLPMPGVTDAPRLGEALAGLAADAGFDVIDLSDWADRHRPEEVKLGPTEHHANAYGHRLIAERLAGELDRRPELLTRASGR